MNFDLLFEKQKIYKENLHLIPKEVLEKVQTAFHIEFTHNSTAIEGNTLTLIETKVVLEDHVSIGGKKLREIYEVVATIKLRYMWKSASLTEHLSMKRSQKIFMPLWVKISLWAVFIGMKL